MIEQVLCFQIVCDGYCASKTASYPTRGMAASHAIDAGWVTLMGRWYCAGCQRSHNPQYVASIAEQERRAGLTPAALEEQQRLERIGRLMGT